MRFGWGGNVQNSLQVISQKSVSDKGDKGENKPWYIIKIEKFVGKDVIDREFYERFF